MNRPTKSDTITPEYPEYRDWYCPVDGVPSYANLTRSAYRLRWTLNGPLTSAISVMTDTDTDPQNDIPDEPYCQSVNNDNVSLSPVLQWHSISKEPITHIPISSVIVEVEPLAEWEEHWLELHKGHSIPPGGDDPRCAGGDFNSSAAQYGPLPDHDDAKYDPDGDDDWPESNGPGSGHLISCCGSKRPRKTLERGRLLVTVEARTGGKNTGPGFLTTHDYVEQIHPWLMSMRDDIWEADAVKKALLGEGPEEFTREEILEKRKDETLIIGGKDPKYLDVLDDEDWLGETPRARRAE
ncbi:hypothetical protein V8F33_009201 [Rhypophila sp. PSN 637]